LLLGADKQRVKDTARKSSSLCSFPLFSLSRIAGNTSLRGREREQLGARLFFYLHRSRAARFNCILCLLYTHARNLWKSLVTNGTHWHRRCFIAFGITTAHKIARVCVCFCAFCAHRPISDVFIWVCARRRTLRAVKGRVRGGDGFKSSRAQNDFFQVWVQKNVNNFYNRWTFVFISARVRIYTVPAFWSPGLLRPRGTYLLAAW
jgi:hypothetical protein